MPLVLPTPDEYDKHLSAYARGLAVRRLFAAAGDLDELAVDSARAIYARLDQDCPEVLAARRRVLETQYVLPKGWRRAHYREAS